MLGAPRLAAVLDALAAETAITTTQRDRLLRAEAPAAGTPWFVRLLVGLGAWIAAVLFVVFLGLAQVVASEADTVVVGVILLAASTAARRRLRHDFWTQLTLAANLAGQALFVGGTYGGSGSVTRTSVVALLLGLALIALYPDKVLRFLATVGVVAAVLAPGLQADAGWWVDLVVAATGWAAVLLWLTAPRARDLDPKLAVRRPMAFGLTVSLLVLCLAFPVARAGGLWHVRLLGWPASAGVAAALLYVEARLLRHYRVFGVSRATVATAATTGLLLLLTWRSPGIVASLLVFVLAVSRGSRVLFGIASVFLVTFVVFLYRNLDASLLVKSGMLAATGAVLVSLGGYVALRLRGSGEAAP